MVTSLSIGTGGLGRFGNQMWTIAGVIGIATKNGLPFGFPKWVNNDAALIGGERDEMGQYFVNPLPPIPEGVTWNLIDYHWPYQPISLSPGMVNQSRKGMVCHCERCESLTAPVWRTHRKSICCNPNNLLHGYSNQKAFLSCTDREGIPLPPHARTFRLFCAGLLGAKVS